MTKAPTSGDGPPVLRVRLWLRAARTGLRRPAQCRPQRGFPSKRLRPGGREPRAQGPALQTPGVAGSNPGPHQFPFLRPRGRTAPTSHTSQARRPQRRLCPCTSDMPASAKRGPSPATRPGPARGARPPATSGRPSADLTLPKTSGVFASFFPELCFKGTRKTYCGPCTFIDTAFSTCTSHRRDRAAVTRHFGLSRRMFLLDFTCPRLLFFSFLVL